ncbi:hypothetical protein CDV36_004541 [Fusarium kuroshium]|uniref:Major facilitator superfamily (MFS) profile domain-containing protein n=1 Tax=Fusarium kuroshium TaxID=2010991 RepID=A0A3M2SDZ9_9HYPO|nr:hypothetical protein CDV36_004541 [Fusarium kuroshium]
MGLYFTAVGVMAVQPLVIGWCVNQVASSSKRGTVAAFAGSMGQIGGIISALAFPKKDAPQYVPVAARATSLDEYSAADACLILCVGYPGFNYDKEDISNTS